MPFFAPNAPSTEAAALAAYLEHQCRQLRSTVHGLTTAQSRLTPLPSALSLAGLLAHSAQVVHGWLFGVMKAPEPVELSDYEAINAKIGLEGMFSGAEVPDMSLEDLLAVFDRSVAYIREAEGVAALGAPVPVPDAPWFPDDMVIDARWVWSHLTTEVARHVGHADLIREAIDGQTAYALNDAVDAESAST